MINATKRAQFDNTSPFEGLDKVLHETVNVVKCKYDFAALGGAVGTLDLLDDDGKAVVIPDNAIIMRAFVDVVTAMTSTAGTGTIALQSEGAGDLLATVDADTLSGIVAGIPVAAASAIKMTADRTIKVVIATNALLSGKFNLYIEYVLGE